MFPILNSATETFLSQNTWLKAGLSQVELSNHLFTLYFHSWVEGTMLVYLQAQVYIHILTFTHTYPELNHCHLKTKKTFKQIYGEYISYGYVYCYLYLYVQHSKFHSFLSLDFFFLVNRLLLASEV